IVDGLIKAISILDELIQTIRASKNKADAKANIIAAYQFSDEQAEAILALQLYRLTNTDITQLTEEKSNLQKQIAQDEAILAHPKSVLQTIKKDLLQLKRQYANERLTTIEAEIEEIKSNIDVTVPQDSCIVAETEEGYIKRPSLRSYGASNNEDLMINSTDRFVR